MKTHLFKQPFKTDEEAFNYLYMDYTKKLFLSNYEPTMIDWAIAKLFMDRKYKRFKNGN